MSTGNFERIINNQLSVEDEDRENEVEAVGPNDVEISVYERLIRWSKRLQKLFSMVQGLLAGLAMLHLYLLMAESDAVEFLIMYARLTRVIACFFHALVLIALIGTLHATFTERRHCNPHSVLRISQTVIDYDAEKHRRPYYVALLCSICISYTGYAVAHVLTTFNVTASNQIYWDYELNNSWPSTIDSSFESKVNGWRYICVIREVLVILAWFILCAQSYWNLGTFFRMKISALQRTEPVSLQYVPEEVYRHLFFGNPYIPDGVFTLADPEVDPTKKAA